MSFLRALFGPSQEEIWGQLAGEIGGALTGGGWEGYKVQAQAGDWIVTLDTYTVSTGKSSVTYTRMRAPFVNRDGFQFTIYRAGLFTELGKLFGMQDIEIGDPFFDETFVVKGNREDKIRALFGNANIASLLHAQPSIFLAIQEEQNWLWGPKYPESVQVLYFQVGGIIKDPMLLKALFTLYAEVLHHLGHMDSAYLDDVSLHIRDLNSPGGRIEAEKVVLWDGGPPRRKAAEALGRLKAREARPHLVAKLRDQDPLLRAMAAWSLGEIGERGAAPPLLRLLGDSTPAGARSVRYHAMEALRVLGEGELVSAFEKALQGDAAALETLRVSGRPEFNDALQQLVAGPSVKDAINAIWALGELGAVEALTQIQTRARALRNTITPEQMEVVSTAINQLKRHTQLPRPASTPAPVTANLPRPADDADQE